MIDVIAVCGIRNSAKSSVKVTYRVRNDDIVFSDIAVTKVRNDAVEKSVFP